MRKPTLTTVTVNGNRLSVRSWGSPRGQPLLLLHGWADCAASYQFVANHFGDEYHLISLDFRGFGDSSWVAQGYVFPDYLADVDAVVKAFLPERPFALVGHSMGGNVAGLYAGIRPERISRLVLLEGFGLPPSTPDKAPQRYREWLDQLQTEAESRAFDSPAAVVQRLRRLAPFASDAVLQYVASEWATATDGHHVLKMDPKHKWVNPVLYRREEARACWQATTADVLLVVGGNSNFRERFPGFGVVEDVQSHYRHSSLLTIPQAGHMLHLDQPLAVANAIKSFVAGVRPT